MGEGESSYEQVIAEMAAAEDAEGWLARCEREGRYVALNAPFVDALARALQEERGPIVELGAGDGRLREALGARGVTVTATDANPQGASVERADAEAALARHRPATVLTAFPPLDAGIEERALAHPAVRAVIAINARIGGAFGSSGVQEASGWHGAPLQEPTRWLLTRHDVWLGPGSAPIRHGEVWRYARVAEEAAV